MKKATTPTVQFPIVHLYFKMLPTWFKGCYLKSKNIRKTYVKYFIHRSNIFDKENDDKSNYLKEKIAENVNQVALMREQISQNEKNKQNF